MSYTENHLVEQPAIQLMQHELGWDVAGNIEHRTPNIEHRSEEKRKTGPAMQRLNPDLPADHSSPWLRMARAIEPFFANHSSPRLRTAEATKVKAVEERGILNVGFLILNGRGRRPPAPRLNQNSEEVEG